MIRLTLALVVGALVGCGTEDDGPQSVEDFVDPALLEQVENEVQAACLVGNSIIWARADECGIPIVDDQREQWESGCLMAMPPMPEPLRLQSECHETWAFGSCDDLRGAAGEPCTLIAE